MNRELHMLTETFKDGIKVVQQSQVPAAQRKCPFLNPVIREKLDAATGTIIDLRTRLTWGVVPKALDPTTNSSSVAASTVVKLLLNSAVSDPFSDLSSIDLDYFYYNTKRDKPEYARTYVRLIPMASRIKLGIADLPESAIVYLECSIAIPGQPDAGKLAQQALIAHLKPHGYRMCRHTPCLFYHKSRPSIKFPTHVDDLLVKHDRRTDDFNHLCAALRQKYSIKVQHTATSHLGMRIQLHRDPKNPANDSVTIDIPNGVRNALKSLSFQPTGNPKSPMIYTPPTYTKADQDEVTDESPQASTEEKQYLMKAVGYFRYYAPAVDITLIPAASKLAMQQSKPTKNTMKALERFLNYAYHHPNAAITYRPSNMVLWIHSDASHHGEPRSRSRTGIFMTCGEPQFTGIDNPYNVNGAVDVISSILSYVTGSTAESEYGTMYVAGTAAIPHRQCLEDLGHPQPPTPIVYDNQVAGKIANGTAKAKRTKAIAKCFHWLRDRIRKKYFVAIWRPGKHNLGDFFSKIHPVAHWNSSRPVYVSTTFCPNSNPSNKQPKSCTKLPERVC